jgi:hypothetical protein
MLAAIILIRLNIQGATNARAPLSQTPGLLHQLSHSTTKRKQHQPLSFPFDDDNGTNGKTFADYRIY